MTNLANMSVVKGIILNYRYTNRESLKNYYTTENSMKLLKKDYMPGGLISATLDTFYIMVQFSDLS